MLLRKIKSVIKYFIVFKTVNDIRRFRSLFHKTDSHKKELVSLRVRQTKNHELFCRPNTTDHQVLWDTFHDKYHLPPSKLNTETPVIVDLGSNAGYTMAHFAYLFPGSKVYGVEMDAGNYALAKQNLSAISDQCSIMQAAVWTEDGQIFYDQNEEWAFRINTEKAHHQNAVSAPAKTLNTIFNEFGINEIDYLKMDIEGAEKNILENPSPWIGKVKTIKIEVHLPFTISACMQILEKHGFDAMKDPHHPYGVSGVRKSIQKGKV